LEIEEITDISTIIEDKVQSIPTLRINAHVDIVFNESRGIDDFIAESTEHILHEFAPELLSKVLVPIDFSDASMNAFKYALDMSKTIGSEIELLHVNHPSPLVVDGMVIVDRITTENQKYNLQRIVDQNKQELHKTTHNHEIVTLQFNHLDGFAGDEIIRISKEKDLIVMGTTGASNVKKLLGSVSLKVSGKAHCPVIFVSEGQQFKGFDKIVYAYSPTSYDQKVIKDIVEIARKFNSEIHLLHVDDGTAYEEYDIDAFVSLMYEDVNFICKNIKADSVAFGIAHYAEQIDADLIILSKKKKNLLQKVVDGSATKSTLLQAKKPVMIFHNDDHGCLCGGACRRKPESTCNH
jgi:nucleotide-binding universal stress UspA family protein